MVGADQAELATHASEGGTRAGEGEDRRACDGGRAPLQEVPAITAKLGHDTLLVDARNVASLSWRGALVDATAAA